MSTFLRLMTVGHHLLNFLPLYPFFNTFPGDFDATGTTFNVDDWIAHTPTSILALNFGLNESVFKPVPTPNPYILKGSPPSETDNTPSPYGKLTGNSSYTYHLSQQKIEPAPGRGGTIAIVDSRNFPIATTIAAAVVTLEPGGLRELHWHPNVSSRLLFWPAIAVFV